MTTATLQVIFSNKTFTGDVGFSGGKQNLNFRSQKSFRDGRNADVFRC